MRSPTNPHVTVFPWLWHVARLYKWGRNTESEYTCSPLLLTVTCMSLFSNCFLSRPLDHNRLWSQIAHDPAKRFVCRWTYERAVQVCDWPLFLQKVCSDFAPETEKLVVMVYTTQHSRVQCSHCITTPKHHQLMIRCFRSWLAGVRLQGKTLSWSVMASKD